ncbi:MAG: AI-2E family transporter YdiK [Burkholderiales bacterium]|nr:AI-2E family transporter YdiK [Burkholderiales bacterium]
MAEIPRDLTRTVLAVLTIGLLIAATLWILRPFLPSLVWATMIAVATWPLLIGIQAHLWGRRWLAATALTLALLLVFVIPFSLAIGAIVQHVDEISAWAKSVTARELPPPPEWVLRLPLIGERADTAWRDTVASGGAEFLPKIAPYVGHAARWFAGQVGGLGLMIVQFLLTVVITAILYVSGESLGAGVRGFVRRLAGERGDGVVILAAQAIRGVALGVVLTALVQAALGGIGLAVAGIPFAPVLTVVMFILAIAQIGVWPVLFPAIAWLYWTGDPVWGTALLLWTIPVVTLDNILRPFLIKRGADLPLLLIFAGVIGGLLAFGLIGIFIGPVLLAVTYKLLAAWVAEGSGGAPVEPRTPGGQDPAPGKRPDS